MRSLDSYHSYYERWAETWEFQALTRARPIAGDEALGRAFVELIDPYRYPAAFEPEQVQQIRRMKARVENERMPHGADRTRQLKLGRGGLSDVEWLVQLVQLRHAHAVPGLRTTSTLKALGRDWSRLRTLKSSVAPGYSPRRSAAATYCAACASPTPYPRDAPTWKQSPAGADTPPVAHAPSKRTICAKLATPAKSTSASSSKNYKKIPEKHEPGIFVGADF